MKHKGLKNVIGLSLVLVLGLFMSSCGDDNPAPTLKLVINSTDGFTIDIGAKAENADTWSWDYGDGNTSTTVGGHQYTYSERGDFTITCTVTGPGGSVTEQVDAHIASIEELLTAHPWQLSNAGNNGLGLKIDNNLAPSYTFSDVYKTINDYRNENETYDFTQEYDDVYTFNANGTYEVNAGGNGNVVAPWLYAKSEVPSLIKGSCEALGYLAVGLGDVKDASWKLIEDASLTVNTVTDANMDGEADDMNSDGVLDEKDVTPVKFLNTNFVSFKNGGFLGMKDYGVTDGTTSFESIAIINSISTDELTVSLLLHMAGGGTIGKDEPAYFVNLTFKAVQ